VIILNAKYSPAEEVSTPNPPLPIQCCEIFELATAPRNIRSTLTLSKKSRVRGAGTSIVAFASQQGRLSGSQGEVFLHSLPSSIDFYKKKLHFKEVPASAEHDGWIPFDCTPLLLSAEEADKLQPSS
jgi:hypothetical protein